MSHHPFLSHFIECILMAIFPIAVVSGIACLFSRKTRVAVPVGLLFAVVGFFLSIAAIGGFKEEPGSWGRAVAFAMGIPGAGAGLLIGLGSVVIFKNRFWGLSFLAAGLVLPVVIIILKILWAQH